MPDLVPYVCNSGGTNLKDAVTIAYPTSFGQLDGLNETEEIWKGDEAGGR